MKQNYEHVAFVESFSEPGKKYSIRRRYRDDVLVCYEAGKNELCKAWQFSRGEKRCKHVDAFRSPAFVPSSTTERQDIVHAGEKFSIVRAIKFKKQIEKISTDGNGWIPFPYAGPTGAGAQVFVAYRNANHPKGWNVQVQSTPIMSAYAIEPEYWRPIDWPEPPERSS